MHREGKAVSNIPVENFNTVKSIQTQKVTFKKYYEITKPMEVNKNC